MTKANLNTGATAVHTVTPHVRINLSVKEMCQRLNLSRSRVAQLVRAGVLLGPSRDPRSGRPYFPQEVVERNLQVRRTGVGANDEPALFYSPRIRSAVESRTGKSATVGAARQAATGDERHGELTADLASLGLVGVTEAEVAAALKALRGEGIPAPDTRAVYRKIKRNRTSDS